jgi:hypothetical protein
MPATLAGDINRQLRREQVLAVVGKKGIHRPLREQVAAPGRRVQLLIGWVAGRGHAAVCPRAASGANARIGPRQIDDNDRTPRSVGS